MNENTQSFLDQLKIDFVLKTSTFSVFNNNKIYNFLIHNIERNDVVSQTFLKLLLLGIKDKNDIVVQHIYKLNISHIFVVSGFHFGLVGFGLMTMFKKLKINNHICYFSTFVILFLLLCLLNFSISGLRCFVYFVILYLLDCKKPNKSNKVLAFYLTLFINFVYMPTLFYNIGAIASYSLTFMCLNVATKDTRLKFIKINLLAYILSLVLFSSIMKRINVLALFYQLLFSAIIPFIYLNSLLFFWSPYTNYLIFNSLNWILNFLTSLPSTIPILSFGTTSFLYFYLFCLPWFYFQKQQKVKSKWEFTTLKYT
ncbi:ComEC/Rec2 family competence protein [Mycoplasma sp. 1573]